MKKENISYREFLIASFLFIFSSLTVPLLGAVDVSVVGRLEDSTYISGVTIGVTVFNTLFWVFGFLRVSTTGFTAQAMGKMSREDMVKAVFRPMIIAGCVGTLFVLLQRPVWLLAKTVLCNEEKVARQAEIYFSVLIWMAPFVLIGYVCLGYIMGIGKYKESVFLQSIGNAINIVLDLYFVTRLHMGVFGVALATAISQMVTFCVGIIFLWRFGHFRLSELRGIDLWNRKETINMLTVNLDMMMRTTCLVCVSNLTVRFGGQFSSDVLAANSVFGQIIDFETYAFEGLGNATSPYAGRAVGEKNYPMLRELIQKTFLFSSGLIVITELLFFLFHNQLIRVFTDLPEVIARAQEISAVGYVFPLVACIGFSLYGIFSGATMPKPGRNALIGGSILFLVLSKLLIPIWGNLGLWIARLAYFGGRSFFILPYLKNFDSMKRTEG